MNLYVPKEGTYRAKVAELLHKDGPQTFAQIVERSGGMRLHDVNKAIADMAKKGAIVERGENFELTDAIRRYYDGVEPEPKYVGEIAGPRTQNVYGPTIDLKKLPSGFGTRPGSNDHLTWKSKHV